MSRKSCEGALTDESLKALRRGWYPGDESFRDKVLDRPGGAVSAKRRKRSVRGAAARAHDEAEAERPAKAGLEAPGLPATPRVLTGRGKRLEEKSALAALIRRRTAARNDRVAERLGMGTEGNGTRALRRTRTERRLDRRLKELERMIEKRDPADA